MSAFAFLHGIATSPRRRWLLDAGVAAAAFVASRALLSHGGLARPHSSFESVDLLGFVLLGCSTLPLVAWRRLPIGVFAVSAAAGVALAGLGYGVDLLLGPGIALYLLAAGRDGAARWPARNTWIVVGFFAAFLGASAAANRSFPGLELLHTGLAWAVAWFAGERTRLLRGHILELRERAVRARHEAERERQLAAVEERMRIARDLHDSAGHAISLIAVRAGAARLKHAQDSDRALKALEEIEELARQTAQEIDQIVATLREPGSGNGEVETPPGTASIDTLIARHRAAGLEIGIERSGPQPTLAGPSDQAVYRILQEALTNASRHGSGSAQVELRFGRDAVTLTVTNPASAGGEPQGVGGHGVIGMRERAALLGGTLDAEPVNGTFHIRARIPYGGLRP
jgi:signal transduction histidine kinase